LSEGVSQKKPFVAPPKSRPTGQWNPVGNAK